MNEIIQKLLYEWKEKTLPQVQKRELSLEGYLDQPQRKVTAITGFRRVGKTYLIFHLIQQLLQQGRDKEEVTYINFEDERIPPQTEFLTQLLPTIKEAFQKPLTHLFLDEVQNIPNWSKWLRRIYDNEKIHIFVTGSSSKLSSHEIPTELRGRCLQVLVYPLSLREFFSFKNFQVDPQALEYSENQKAQFLKLFREYLQFGAMPEVVLSNPDKKLEILQEYYKTVVQVDVIERFDVKNQEGLKSLLRLLVNSTYYSISKLYHTLKSLSCTIGKTTLLHYLGYIENSYFLYSIPIFSPRVKDQLYYPRKVYFIDNGFITALSTKFSHSWGQLYENMVFVELKRRSNIETEILYWKDSTGKEVDFVIKQGLEMIQLIQVCYDIEDNQTKQREVKALLKASIELRCKNLLIITQKLDTIETVKGTKIVYRPLWKWLLYTPHN